MKCYCHLKIEVTMKYRGVMAANHVVIVPISLSVHSGILMHGSIWIYEDWNGMTVIPTPRNSQTVLGYLNNCSAVIWPVFFSAPIFLISFKTHFTFRIGHSYSVKFTKLSNVTTIANPNWTRWTKSILAFQKRKKTTHRVWILKQGYLNTFTSTSNE